MVTVKVPSAAEVAKKWGEETPRRSTYYQLGTAGAGADWEKGASESASNFKAAIQASDIEARFRGGIKKAGAAKYQRKIASVGVSRFGPGVTAAIPDMQANVADALQMIASTDIVPRKPRGDPGNYDRTTKIGNALHAQRLAKLAAGT